MADKDQQIKLINQALTAARASIDLAKELLADFSALGPKQEGGPAPAGPGRTGLFTRPLPSSLPGLIGSFDGESLVTADGKKYAVPGNYASKTQLVVGDKLKMIESDQGGSGGKIFKQIERIKRQRLSGQISKKGEGWYLKTADGEYQVLDASIKHFAAVEGSPATGLIPRDRKNVSFAALESISPKSPAVVPPAAEAKLSIEKLDAEKPLLQKVEEKVEEKPSKKPAVKVSKAEKTGGEKAERQEKAKAEPIKKPESLIGEEDLR